MEVLIILTYIKISTINYHSHQMTQRITFFFSPQGVKKLLFYRKKHLIQNVAHLQESEYHLSTLGFYVFYSLIPHNKCH